MSLSCLPKGAHVSLSCLPKGAHVSLSCLPKGARVSLSCLPKGAHVSLSCLPKGAHVSLSCLPKVPTCLSDVSPEFPTCLSDVSPKVPTCLSAVSPRVPTCLPAVCPRVSKCLSAVSPRVAKKQFHCWSASVQFQLKKASQRSERPIRAPPRLSEVPPSPSPSSTQRQGSSRNSANVCLVEHRSFPTSEDGILAASCLHCSFLQAINAVMLWPVHVQKIPEASEHLCSAKLQTRCGRLATVTCVTASTSMVRPEVVTLWAPLSSCTVLPPCLTMNAQPDRSLVTEPSTMSCGVLLASTSMFTFALPFPAGHSRQCVNRFSDSSLVVGLELNCAFYFPVSYLLELCEAAHMLD